MRSLVLWLTTMVVVIAAIVGYAHWRWGGIEPGGGGEAWHVRGGEARQGREPILGYGCGACHVIDGIGRATGRVGPKLQDLHEQIYIGGVVTNTAENLVRWIMFPRELSPRTAMPDLDVKEQDARNIAAYLYQES